MTNLDDNTSGTGSVPLDTSLLSAMTRGDEAAMATFYSRHSTRVYSVAMRVLRDASSAEDVLQDVFLQIWRNPADFIATRGSLEGWLAVVTRNRAIDVVRKRKPSDRIEDLPLPSTQDVAAEAEANVALDRVKQLAAALPLDQRTALDLAFFKGLSHTEIAARTGDPLGTVKTRIRVAVQTLRKGFQA